MTRTKFNLVLLFFLTTFNLFAQIPAFLGAEGFGKYAIGGRGGQVISVTNLNDSGTGSFRAAVESEGPRTVIFEVGGRINLQSTVNIDNPYITIAGQHSVGDGITLSMEGTPNKVVLSVNTNDVIIRYLTIRRSEFEVSEQNSDALVIRDAHDVIVDHCSFSWASDENIAIYDYDGNNKANVYNITIQNCLIDTAWGGSDKGIIASGGVDRLTFYNLLFTAVGQRQPLIKNETGNYVTADTYFEIINTITFEGKLHASFPNNIQEAGVKHLNYINNLCIDSGFSRNMLYVSTAYPVSIFTKGNISPLRTSITSPVDWDEEWSVIQPGGGQADVQNTLTKSYRVTTPKKTPIITDGVALIDAINLFDSLKGHVGASLPTRDSEDARAINDVETQLSTAPTTSSTFPILKNGVPLDDLDNDGMPDSWETKMGLNINNSNDRNIVNNDGYTNLEWYLNGIDGDNTPAPSVEVNAGENQTICKEEEVTLKATGASTYEWNTGEKTQSITVTPSKTTTYTVTGKDDSGHSDTDEVKVTVQDLPTVDAGEDATICEGATVELTATGSGDFEWSTGAKTKTISVKPDNTTTYTVTISNGSCSDSDEVTVTVSPRQTINAGSDVNIDLGESTKLSLSGTGSIKWSTGETSREITVSPNQTTTYTVAVSQNGCESQDEVKVTVNATKVEIIADAGTNQTICEGKTVTLTASGGSSYFWSTGETTASIKVTPSETTTYSVEVSEGSVSDIAEVTVNVNALPDANAGADKTINQGESITLIASGGSTYKWSTGATTKSITVAPNQTRTYTVEVFNNGDCSDSDAVKVTVNATKVEVIADAGSDQTICEGETVTLTASGGSSYAWSNGEATSSIKVTPSTTTTYAVEVSEGTVSDTAEVTVTVNALPNANAGSDKTIEQGESITLTASGGSTYKWSTGATTKDITVSPNTTETYTVEVFNSGDCSDTDQVKVIVNATKVEVIADAGSDQMICEGETVTLTASGGSSYEWSTGETTASIKVAPSTTTTYSVEVSEGTVSDIAEVTVNVNALPDANAGADKTINQGESVTLSASGGISYKWSTGATTQDITVTPNQIKTYTVEVFNNGDCSDTDQVKVTVNIPVVEANAGSEQTICEGETVTLTASGGSSYAWSTGESTSSIKVTPSTTTTYSVEVSEGSVSDTANVTVTVNALPSANAGADQTIEHGERVTLTASGGTSYLWSSGERTQSISVSPNNTTVYTVEVYNAGGCFSEDNVVVNIESLKLDPEVEQVDFELSVYPNPATDILNLKMAGLDESTLIRIFDMSGKLLYNDIIQSDGGLMHKVLDVSNYPKGFYLLSIIYGRRIVTKKIVLR